ncbi:MAG: DNA polymerase III subunit delta [Gammaproteobacteria bacterium]|nr:DNA polymerase III subunit delta [Gammaproteobacteria bacterium]
MKLIYLIYGENQDLIQTKKDELISKFNIDDFNTSIFDLEETVLSDAIADALSIPFLSDYRLVIFKNAHYFSTSKDKKQTEEDEEKLKEFLENYPETTISLFLVPDPTLDGKKTIVKIAKEKGEVIPCLPYTKEDITRYVDQKLMKSGHVFTTEARNELLSRIDSDPLNFKNEVEKLLLYLEDGERITDDIIKKLIIKDPEDNVFELLNAIVSKDKRKAINIYYDLLKCGNNSLSLLGLIERKFEEILYSKELLKTGATQEDFVDTFRVSKGRAYFMMRNARDMSYKTIKLWLNRMVKLDYEIKLGKVDQDSGVELLILKA